MRAVFFHCVLAGLFVSFLCQKTRGDVREDDQTTLRGLAVKDVVRGHLRRIRLWEKVREGRRKSSHRGARGRPSWFIVGLLLLSGDVEVNPGPRTGKGGDDLGDIDGTTELTMKDHFVVRKYTDDLNQQEVKDLGLALGLYRNTFHKMSPPTTHDDIIEAWLKRKDNVIGICGTTTWRALAKGFQAVEQHGCVENIRRDHPSQNSPARGRVDIDSGSKTPAKKVREILLSGIDSESEAIRTFSNHLRECYTRESQHPSHYQWPEIHHQHYIEQVIYRQEQSGHSKDSKRLGPPVKLEEILDENQRIVMIEGVAGSGKTTLLWYLCKQWAEGKLLDKFHLLIHISLNDLYIKDAKSLADIIPHPDETLQKAVAQKINGNCGELKVCFLLDSCDEAPISLQNGFLKKFLEKLPMNCRVLLTSRPTATDYLTSRHIAHDKMYLQGCKSGVIFDTLLQNDSEKKKKINNLLELKPEMCALCDLPINAIILIFIHEMLNRDNVPITRTGLYTLMIINFLVRHMKAPSVQQYRGPIRDIERDLPPEIDRKLRKLCLLAYNAVSSNKNVMTYSELMKEGMEKPDESFGLLQIRESVTVYGPELIYSFPHLSIQEFLAAIHIKRIGNEEEEASAIKRLDDKDPLNPVITFYAGLTKFRNKKVQDLLLQKLKNVQFDFDKVLDNITCKSNDPRRSLLSLLNCIYESQDEALAKLYDPTPALKVSLFHGLNSRCLSFPHLALYPSDCLSIGYYVRQVRQVINLVLRDCHINEVGVEVLTKELKKGTSTSDNELYLYLGYNSLTTHRGIKPIKTLLSGQSNITFLDLTRCIRPKSIQRTFLKCVVEGLDNNSTLQSLAIGGCGITFIHVHYLVLLLTTNNSLKYLELSLNNLGKAIPLLSKVLKFSRRLQMLVLRICNIDDHGLNCLTKAAVEHPSLCQLELCFNPLTSAGVRESLLIFQRNPYIRLTRFGIDKDRLNEDIYRIVANINSSRPFFVSTQYDIMNEYSKEYSTKVSKISTKELSRN